MKKILSLLIVCAVICGCGMVSKKTPESPDPVAYENKGLRFVPIAGESGKGYSEDLEGGWLFNRGNDLRWAAPEYNDSGWEKILVPGRWEEKYPDYDGFGWYRLHFKIPTELGKEPLFLFIGGVDDVDECYLNGFKIGESGRMPPDFQTAWDKKRRYSIPPDVVKSGGPIDLIIRKDSLEIKQRTERYKIYRSGSK